MLSDEILPVSQGLPQSSHFSPPIAVNSSAPGLRTVSGTTEAHIKAYTMLLPFIIFIAKSVKDSREGWRHCYTVKQLQV